jgi:hypothetical protein
MSRPAKRRRPVARAAGFGPLGSQRQGQAAGARRVEALGAGRPLGKRRLEVQRLEGADELAKEQAGDNVARLRAQPGPGAKGDGR